MDINKLNLSELKDLCKKAGIEVEGHKGHKKNYIAALSSNKKKFVVTEANEYREQVKSDIVKLSDDLKFEKDEEKVEAKVEDLVTKITLELKYRYPDDHLPVEKRFFRTCWNFIQELKKDLIKNLPEGLYSENKITVIRLILKRLEIRFIEYKSKENKDYRRRVQLHRTIKSERITVDPSMIIKRAHHILSTLEQDWRPWQISCAIAITTGRRGCEIHTCGQFRKIDDYTLEFKGQAKGKNRLMELDGELIPLKEYPFQIPTLVKTDLILAGLNKLETLGYIYRDLDPDDVNPKISKGLSREVKRSWIVLEPYREGDKTINQTYHFFRSFYFAAATHNKGVEHGDLGVDHINYARQIMGDDHLETIEAYARFIIKPDSITKI